MPAPASFDDLVVATLMETVSEVEDAVLNATPLFSHFVKDGRVKSMIGRGRIMPVVAPLGTNARFTTMYDQIDLTTRNVLKASQWTAKFAQETNGMWLEEEIKNRPNKTKLVDIVEARKKSSIGYMTNLLGQKSVAPTAVDGSMDSIPVIVADTPTNKVGEIDRSVTGNEWWKNQSVGLQAFAGTGVQITPAILFKCMRYMQHLIEDVKGKTSSIFASNDYYEMYAEYLEDKKLITSQESTVDGGFTALKFMGTPVYRDYNIAAGHMYFLDERNIYMGVTKIEGSSAENGFQFMKQRHVVDYHRWIVPCVWDGTIMCDNCRTQGVIH